jgi:hypothetical protein
LNIPIPGATFACLAETYLMAREGMREHSVGAPAPEFALRLEQVAARHGVRPARLDFGDTIDVDVQKVGTQKGTES